MFNHLCMSNSMQKNCCFTGHRPGKLNRSEDEICMDLRAAIFSAMDSGYRVFISGMSTGVDIWAAEIVLELKQKDYPIELVAAVPFPNSDKFWTIEWKRKYRYILDNADMCVVIGNYQGDYSFMLRNKWMVDYSDRVIAVWSGKSGGTQNTIDYARKKQRNIVIIAA